MSRLLLPLLALLLLTTGCNRTEPVYNSRFLAFGTINDISIVGVTRQQAEKAVAALEQDFAAMHRSWHAWDPGPLGRTNRLLAEGVRFAAPPSVLPLIRLSKILAEQSEGLFDPAIGKLIALWGFHQDPLECKGPPDEAEIEKLVQAHPSMTDIEVNGIFVRSRNPAVQLDFGAIGKGYGIDLAIEHLRELGIENAIVNSGGDLRAIGSRGGHPWRVAVRSPTGSGTLGYLDIAGDESVFTSGDYERFCQWEGKRYHHILDPRTGYPAQGTRSVTVIHDNAAVADAAATALFVAGPDDWHRIARKMGIHYVLLVDQNDTIHMNPAMAARVHLLEKRRYRVKISPPLMEEKGPAGRLQ